MLLIGCTQTQANKSVELYKAPPWPEPVNLQKQSGVAKYITRGKAAYDGCVVNLKLLEGLDNGNTDNK